MTNRSSTSTSSSPKRKRIPRRPYYRENLFDKKHMFAGTSLKNNPEDMGMVFDAYELNKLPEDKKLAIGIETIQVEVTKARTELQMEQESSEVCRTCGYVCSPRCDDCKRRVSKKFGRIVENMWIPTRAVGMTIDLDRLESAS